MADDSDSKGKPHGVPRALAWLMGGLIAAGWVAQHDANRPPNINPPPTVTSRPVVDHAPPVRPPSRVAAQPSPRWDFAAKPDHPAGRQVTARRRLDLQQTPASGQLEEDARAGVSPPSVPLASPGQPPPTTSARPPGHALAAPTPPPEIVLTITPDARVDEQLFLLRVLETLYQDWPGGQGDPRMLQEAIDEMRHTATRHQLYIRERKLDERIAGLYGDLIALLDAYVECLAQTGRIEREAADRVGRERADAAARSGFSGGAAAARAMNDGAGGTEALVTWAGITVVGSLMSEMAKAPARDESKRRAIDANVRAFTTRYSEVMAGAEAAVLALAERYGWAPGEAGFDTTPDQVRQVMEISARDDDAALLRHLRLMQIRRPRDPFLRSVTAVGEATHLGDRATLDALIRAADESLSAVTLVPKGAFYDDYRKELLAVAGVLANAATMEEQRERGWVAGPAGRGPRDLSIWRAYFTFDPIDPSGEGLEQLAYALAATGRFAEAATTAGQVAALRRESGEFSYAHACLLSLTGQTAEALRWLEHAYRDCRVGDIRLARADPDLAAVRADQAAGFAELAKVDFVWSIDWGLIDHDDVVLVNRSPFPLTGVRFDVEVASSGSAPWSQTLTAERIEPGETRRWPTWVKARGRDWEGKATLRCDQQPG